MACGSATAIPTTEDGLQRLLDFFIYGMLRASESLGNTPVFLRTVEEAGLLRFMLVNMPEFRASADPVEACRAYTEAVDRAGLFDGSDTAFRGDNGSVEAEVGDRCVYRRVCAMRSDEDLPVHCIRALALTEMLRIQLDADYRWKLESFGRPCRFSMTRDPLKETAIRSAAAAEASPP